MGLGTELDRLPQTHAQWWTQAGPKPVVESRLALQVLVENAVLGLTGAVQLRQACGVRGWHLPRGPRQLDALSSLSAALQVPA